MTGPTTTQGLILKDVTLIHGDGEEMVRALDAVDLTVWPGELVAVVGPSGSGKSSLLAVAGALTAPTRGQVFVAGVDLAELNRRQLTRLRRDHIGFVFQSANLIPALTALDQVRLPLTFAKTGRQRDPARLLDEVGRPTEPASAPTSCRVGRGNASGSPGPWSPIPNCFWSTSQPHRWTASAARRSSACSPGRHTPTASRR